MASAASGVAALGMVPAAEAAIQHSGPQNILVANATTGIDIDGDGSSNFKFEQKYGGGKYFAQIHPLNPAPESNSVIKTSAAGYAKALPTNYLVRSALSTPAVFGIRTQIVNLEKTPTVNFQGRETSSSVFGLI